MPTYTIVVVLLHIFLSLLLVYGIIVAAKWILRLISAIRDGRLN